MLEFLNSVFNEPVVISEDEAKFNKCTFAVQGASNRDQKTIGLKVTGDAAAVISDSTFKNQGYSAIGVQTSGKVVIENNTFDCTKIYNPIEGTVSTGSAVTNVKVKGNIFNGVCGNNYINFYKMADGAVVNIENNKFNNISTDSEVLRLSNPDNTNATFNVVNNEYTYKDDSLSEYTAFILCQDFTNKNGNKQDFSKYNVNIDNLKCNGEKVQGKPVHGQLYIVYEDSVGLITGQNDPAIILK